MVEAHHHRPTLKQQNKPFKSKHSTKGALKDRAKGRIQRLSPKAASAASKSAAQTRLNRRNASKQAQQTKRAALVSATRLFSGVDGAPRIVAVIPLCEDVDAQAVVQNFAQVIDMDSTGCPSAGVWKLRAERFKSTLQFVVLPYRQLYAALDAAKVADYVVFVLSPDIEVTPWGDLLLRCLQAQGLPDVVTVVSPNSVPDPKTRPGILKSLLSFTRYFVPSLQRVFDLSSPSDSLNALRALCEGKPADVKWREGRPWLLTEDIKWTAGESDEPDKGILSVTGVARGAPLNADRLIHIPNFGDFQVSAIYSAPLPRPSKFGGQSMEVEPHLLSEPNASSADSLISTNDPDTMENEQTWPTEEEMQGIEDNAGSDLPVAKNGTTPKTIKKVPRGTSSYQAAWILDEESDDDEDDGNEDDGDVMKSLEDDEPEKVVEEVVEEDEDMVDEPEEEESKKNVVFDDLDMEEESKQLADWRARAKEHQDELDFPDEIDTPKDVPARIRFQRYRGLRSFRTSPWDPYENLPRDYARIFQFEDWSRTERNVKRRTLEGEGVEPGTRVTVHIKDVPRVVFEAYNPASPFTVFGLLQHEHKVSVLNFTVLRNTEFDGPVRSKDPLVMCVGPRRFLTNPIFSQLTRGGGKGTNNVHKFERYLKGGVTSIGTVYGPVVFGNQPCLLLKETGDIQEPHLVAMGTFLPPAPQRIIAKRIILTGHPFKVHKKTATVRYMFFNPEDVSYFAPVQLHTKYGRTGHIRESLGTHGYFKAHFDGPVNQMDTVCMNLYKRVYPKWAALWKETRGGPGPSSGEEVAMEE